MKRTISPDYKTTSLVWDCAAGVRNLTRDFSYSDLYISTYHEAEIELGSEYNTNNQAAFQYDFLNDDVNLNPTDNPKDQWKLPNKLFEALQNASKTNKRVVFYTNPPYGLAKDKKTGKIAKNKVNDLMKGKGLGNAAHQLYTQFFWRVFKIIQDFKLSNVYIAFFTEVPFFTGGDWENFNHKLFSNFKWEDGFMFSAGEFSDTSKDWAVDFSVYKLRQKPVTDKNVLDNLTFKFDVDGSYLDDIKHRHIKLLGTHTMRLVYKERSLTEWAKDPFRKIKKDLIPMQTGTYPQLSSALNESKGKKPSGKMYKDSLGYMVLHADNLQMSVSAVWIVSASAYKGHGVPVEPNNKCFNRAIIAFAARRSIKDTWVNDRDNFEVPNIKSPIFPEFVNDSLIFSLFNEASNQSSFRVKKYSNTGIPGYWANKWFWLSNDYVQSVADDNDNDKIYNDAQNGQDTYVYKQIQKRNFSNEAQKVLNDATKVWQDLFPYRDDYNEDSPEEYLDTWDAGWYQLKQMPRISTLDSYKKFKQDYRALTNKIASNVYKLGMLDR